MTQVGKMAGSAVSMPTTTASVAPTAACPNAFGWGMEATFGVICAAVVAGAVTVITKSAIDWAFDYFSERRRFERAHSTTVLAIDSTISLATAQRWAKAVESCPTKRLDLVLSTRGGDIQGTLLLLRALRRRHANSKGSADQKGKAVLRIWVPESTFSCGTLLAVALSSIGTLVVGPNAHFSPFNPCSGAMERASIDLFEAKRGPTKLSEQALNSSLVIAANEEDIRAALHQCDPAPNAKLVEMLFGKVSEHSRVLPVQTLIDLGLTATISNEIPPALCH